MVAQDPLALSGAEDPPVPWELPDQRASTETQGRQVNKDRLAYQDKEVHQGKMERSARLDQLALRVLQGREESRVLLESMVSRGCQDNRDPQESLGNQVIWVFLARVEQLVKSERGANVEIQEREENLDQTVCKDQRESQERQGQMGQRVVQVLLELWGIWVLLVFRECQVREGSQDLPDPKVTEGRLGRKGLKGRLETMVQGAFLDQ